MSINTDAPDKRGGNNHDHASPIEQPASRPDTIHLPANHCGTKREHWRGDCRGLDHAPDSRDVPAAAIPREYYPKYRICTDARGGV